jgi:hypothetical protein
MEGVMEDFNRGTVRANRLTFEYLTQGDGPLAPGQVAVLGPNRAGYPPTSNVGTVVIGDMPGWQIALIAIGATLLAATVTVLLDRARTAAKLSRWPDRATPATPSAASAGQNSPKSMNMSSRLRTMIAAGLLPHTLHLCVHCQQDPAGFWVSQKRAKTVRRPWCLSCCDGLDQATYDVIAFGSQKDRTDSDGLNRDRACFNPQARSGLWMPQDTLDPVFRETPDP